MKNQKKTFEKFSRSKKAQLIGKAPIYFLVTIILFILIVALFLVSQLQKKAIGTFAEPAFSSKDEALLTLQSYLATPVQVEIDNNKKMITMADLIRLRCIKKTGAEGEEYFGVWQKKTAEILSATYPSSIYSSSGIHISECYLNYHYPSDQEFSPVIEMPFPVPGIPGAKIQLEFQKIKASK